MMATVSVIYRAPKGDAKVCEWGEFTFFDGVAVEIEENEKTAHMIKKMAGNKNFELSEMGTVNKAMDQAALQKPTPEAEPEPDPEPVPEPVPIPEEDPVTDPDPGPVFEDYVPEPVKPKTVPARAKTPRKTAAEKTVKERVMAKRTRAGW
jgi:outer membrane biosynthesis protein TonB